MDASPDGEPDQTGQASSRVCAGHGQGRVTGLPTKDRRVTTHSLQMSACFAPDSSSGIDGSRMGNRREVLRFCATTRLGEGSTVAGFPGSGPLAPPLRPTTVGDPADIDAFRKVEDPIEGTIARLAKLANDLQFRCRAGSAYRLGSHCDAEP